MVAAWFSFERPALIWTLVLINQNLDRVARGRYRKLFQEITLFMVGILTRPSFFANTNSSI